MAFQLSGVLNNIMLLKFFNAYVNNGLNKKDVHEFNYYS